MIIRQSYIDPLSGSRKAKDIEITLTETSIIARYDSIIAEISPDDKILHLLDSKRTFLPPGCNQSQLMRSIGNTIETDLAAKINDPLAIIADRTEYFLVTAVHDNSLTLDRECNFPSGSLVQNMRDREWKSNYRLGLYSRLSQPHPLPFVVKSSKNQIEVLVSKPLNESNIKCWDVYVRKVKNPVIERHWLPDVADSTSNEISVSTYGGGWNAGGGELGSGLYYVSVISKDKYGRINVNESVCHWSKIEIL